MLEPEEPEVSRVQYHGCSPYNNDNYAAGVSLPNFTNVKGNARFFIDTSFLYGTNYK
jgi:hypothetical protein